MPSAQRTIVIDRPIDAVFAFFTTPANDPRWRTHVKEIEGPALMQPGARVHQVVLGPGGRGIAADIDVTDYSPPVHYAFTVVAGPARPAGVYSFASTDTGSTEVTFSLTAELTGIKKMIMAGAVQKSMTGEMASLDTAKRVLESE